MRKKTNEDQLFTRMSGRIAIFVAMLLMVMGLAALSGKAAHGQSTGQNGNNDEITVYLSVSLDSAFNTGKDPGKTTLARVPVKISYMDLADYGLEKFYRYEADSFENGGKYKNQVIVKKPTLLMLYIKALGSYYLDREMKASDIGTDALAIAPKSVATSLYFSKLWGNNHNLMYFVNHSYPLMRKGWGATADYILLKDGDEIDLAMFYDNDFYTKGAFAFFDKTENTISAGGKLKLKLMSTSTTAVSDGSSTFANAPMPHEQIKISENYGKSWHRIDQYETDDSGEFTATFKKPGTYYISAGPKFEQQKDSAPCIAPPVSIVKVRPYPVSGKKEEMDSEGNITVSWSKSSGVKGYLFSTKKASETEWHTEKIDDIDKTEAKIPALKENESICYRVQTYMDDKYVPIGEDPAKLASTGDFALDAPEISKVPAGKNSIALNWSPVEDAASYYVYYRIDGAASWESKESTNTSIRIDGLESDKAYNIKVVALKKAGKGYLLSPDSAVKTAVTERPAPPVKPGKPTMPDKNANKDSFAPDKTNTPLPSKKTSNRKSKFKVKTRAGKGGKITRSKTVTYGKSVLIKIKTNKKYKISKLYIDGKRVKKRKKIKFKNISANHSVRVYFSRRK